MKEPRCGSPVWKNRREIFMEQEAISRFRMLVGDEAIGRLEGAMVAVYGVDGLGHYMAEALASRVVRAHALIDSDQVAESNRNRQIIALKSTVGRLKVDGMRERILDINPDCQVTAIPCFYLPETRDQFDFSAYSYVVDAVDTVTAKLDLVVQAREAGVPIISSMGAGNKLHPELFQVKDLAKTAVCPLARVMRRELKKRGIEHVKVVYSEEVPLTPLSAPEETASGTVTKRQTPGSAVFVPSVAGLILASQVVRDLMEDSGMVPG